MAAVDSVCPRDEFDESHKPSFATASSRGKPPSRSSEASRRCRMFSDFNSSRQNPPHNCVRPVSPAPTLGRSVTVIHVALIPHEQALVGRSHVDVHSGNGSASHGSYRSAVYRRVSGQSHQRRWRAPHAPKPFPGKSTRRPKLRPGDKAGGGTCMLQGLHVHVPRVPRGKCKCYGVKEALSGSTASGLKSLSAVPVTPLPVADEARGQTD